MTYTLEARIADAGVADGRVGDAQIAGARRRWTRAAGWACAATGTLITITSPLADLAADRSTDLVTARLAHLPLLVCAPGLIAGVLGLAILLDGTGRTTMIGRLLGLAGVGVWLVAGVYLVLSPHAQQLLTPLGSVLLSAGMVVLGVQALRRRALTGRARFVPLLVGAWFFVQFPLQLMLFIQRQGHPLYVLLLGVWGLLWTALGLVIVKAPHSRRYVGLALDDPGYEASAGAS